jgi:hypothetical protein
VDGDAEVAPPHEVTGAARTTLILDIVRGNATQPGVS